MPWKFAQVRFAGTTNKLSDFGWCLVIDDHETLLEYVKMRFEEDYKVVIKDWVETRGQEMQRDHFTNYLSSLVYQCATINETSFYAQLDDTISAVARGMFDSLEKYGKIYIKKVGSYMSYNESLEEYGHAVMDELKFPSYSEDDIVIKRWPGGSHHYAKIGRIDVQVDGQVKWNTPEAAKEAAEEFLIDLWLRETNGERSPYYTLTPTTARKEWIKRPGLEKSL